MQLVLEGKVKNSGKWTEYKRHAEEFICAGIQKGSNNVNRTPGGLLWFLPWNNVQYVATATLATTVYSIYLEPWRPSMPPSTALPAPLPHLISLPLSNHRSHNNQFYSIFNTNNAICTTFMNHITLHLIEVGSHICFC